MFPTSSLSSCITGCIPHAHGDGSCFYTGDENDAGYSPRMWGCFRSSREDRTHPPVFPTHVGMFPTTTDEEIEWFSIPRVYGDVSINFRIREARAAYSPTYTEIVPGMFPTIPTTWTPMACIPCIYGDDALYFISFLSLVKKSFVHDTFTLSGSFLNMKRSFSSLP